MSQPGLLYACTVMHRRYRPLEYLFRYRIFSMLIDIDRLDELDGTSRLFSVDRFNLFSFRREDHLPAGESDMRSWVNAVLDAHGLRKDDIQVRLLCMPRVLGWGFDPLSIWYCQSPEGEPVAAICEVHNTFGERHCYLLPAKSGHWPLRERHAKIFHVSPFIDVEGDYAFALDQPGDQLKVAIALAQDGQPLMSATQIGQARAFSSRNLAMFFLRVPFQTAKVLGAIHWHALKLWLRGLPFFRKPEPPLKQVS